MKTELKNILLVLLSTIQIYHLMSFTEHLLHCFIAMRAFMSLLIQPSQKS